MTSRATVTPSPLEARAQPTGRLAVAWSRNTFGLVLLGFAWLIPAFVEPQFVATMFVWDGLVLAAWLLDLRRLPEPAQIVVSRTWTRPPSLSVPSDVQLTIRHGGAGLLLVRAVDTVPHELRSQPPVLHMVVGQAATDATYQICPSRRGEVRLGAVFVRYSSRWRLAERWARAPLDQTVVTCPDLDEARRQSVYLIRSRQAELEKRTTRRQGAGRAFESLREHRVGDDLRDICWTATARRGKLVTRQYEIERSQTICLLFDTGRLMRTRVASLTKLDHAVNAGLALTEVALACGDQVGVLAYARRPTASVKPGRGSAHLGRIVDCLALLRDDEWEADHIQAASQVLSTQKRRSLIVWLTDLAETAMTPEVSRGASQLAARHVVVFVVMGQPDVITVASRRPARVPEMYETTAAQELLQRRAALLARLRSQGALTIEAASSRLAPALVNTYLEVKQRGLL